MRFLRIILFLILLVTTPCWATDYYVSISGTDGSSCVLSPGAGNPCKTIQYVISNATLSGGDFVYIRVGTYDGHVTLTSSDDGTTDSYVTFKSYENENITIQCSASEDEVVLFSDSTRVQWIKWDGRGDDSGYHITFDANDARQRAVHIKNSSYLYFQGCNFIGANSREGVKVCSLTDGNGEPTDDGSKNCTFIYCKFYNNADYGVKITGWGTDDNTFTNCDIYNNGTVAGADRFGVNLSGSEYEENMPDGNIFDSCNIYSNYKHGISILVARNNVIRNCNIYSNGTGDSDGQGIFLSYDCKYALVYNNAVYDNAYYGISCYSSVAGDNSDNEIYNNLLYENLTSGGGSTRGSILLQNSAQNNLIYGNSIYDSQSGERQGILIRSGCTGTVVKNNISWVEGSGYAFQADATPSEVDNNNFHKTGSANCVYYGGAISVSTLNQESWADSNIDENPLWDANYRLTANTPSGSGHTRDGGQDLGAPYDEDKDGESRPQGPGWDMGAYEFVGRRSTVILSELSNEEIIDYLIYRNPLVGLYYLGIE